MSIMLSPVEARLLGALVEKAATTPDSYPLTTNSLRLACNQTSNRDPVVTYDDRMIDSTMLELRQRGLARTVNQAGSRVGKHRHTLDEALGVQSDELAVLAVLLLRGPQTVAELATRTERYAGGPDGMAGVEAAIDRLSFGDDPLVARLTRRPGEREPRIAQLLVVETEPAPAAPGPAPGPSPSPSPSPAPAPAPAPAAPGPAPSAGGQPPLAALEERVATLEVALERQTALLERLIEQIGGLEDV